MHHLTEPLTKIIPSDKLDELCLDYKTTHLKSGKKPNLLKLFKKHRLSLSKYQKVVAILGGGEALHSYLAHTMKTDALLQLLEDTIEYQRKDLVNMSSRDRNDLIKMLLEYRNPPESAQQNTQVNINIDSFLREREVKAIDVAMDDE